MAEEAGWVKIYRELLDKPIWQLSTPEQKVILITLLLMANHKDKKWEWNGRQYECAPGQFVTSLDKIAERAGKNISTQNVRTAIKRFENYDFLTNESTKTGRLISIVNWEIYQGVEDIPNKAPNKDLTKSQQRPNKDLTPNKNDKNDKENKYNVCFEALWEVYPRKKEKAKAYKSFLARSKEGYTEEELLTAAKAYAAECEIQNREERFIKHAATFFGINKPFEDYLAIENQPESRETRTRDGRILE